MGPRGRADRALGVLLANPLDQLLQTLNMATIAIRKAMLQHATQGVSDVAVVHEIVLDLRQDVVGVKVEPGLGAVPTRVAIDRQLRAIGTGRSPGLRSTLC